MAKRFDMNFKNKELKMWLMIMGPAIIIGSILMFTNFTSNPYLPFAILLIGYLIYYPWRYQHRKKQAAAYRKR